MPTANDILNELRELSPLLYDARRAMKRPEVPPGYFESLGDTVMAELQKPRLPEQTRPGVPDGYFSALPDEVMRKIRAQETGTDQALGPNRSRQVRLFVFRSMALAASVAGVILLASILLREDPLPVNDCGDGFACLTREEIRLYVQEHADEFETEQIHEAFQPAITEEALDNPVPADDPVPAIKESAIEQYIEENPATIDFEDASTDIF